ncbi:hypothetical protein Tco_0350032 [Tanacetum coccineum]
MSSDLASSEVTYTSISSHGDPLAWDVDFFKLQEPDSPEAAPASPDYDKKGYQSQKEQKRAKTDKKRKRQVQERDLKPISKPNQPDTRKKSK